MQAESKGSFAVIRYNLRTYESGGVMAVIKGRESAEAVLKQFEQSQTSEDRHIGWRYFLEKTDLKAGMDPVEATNLRQSRLEIREAEAYSLGIFRRSSHAPKSTANWPVVGRAVDQDTLVIPNKAMDLGSCPQYQYHRHGQMPRSLALLGMTSNNFIQKH
jgi:hypothetical protein